MIALVTGANGCVGHAICTQLLQISDYTEVRGLVRSATADLPDGVLAFVGSLEDQDSLVRACAEVDVVFHCAALVHKSDQEPSAFHAVNVVGTGRLLDACNPDRPPRVIHCSTVAVYGESTPRTGISETTPPNPATPYAASKLAAEKLIDAWANEVGAVAVHLRLATVYGPRDRGNIAKMEAAIQRRRFLLPDGGQSKKTFCAVENVARAAVCSARAGSMLVASRAFVVADPKPYTIKEIARALGGNPPSLPLAAALLLARLAGGKEASAAVRKLAQDNVYTLGFLKELPGYSAVRTLKP